jgi:predicted GNAT family acetyltransferase
VHQSAQRRDRADVGRRGQIHRRRGIAEAMTRWLARSMQANGNDLVFLMAAGEAEARIYGRAGFEAIGYFLHISRG